MRSGIYLQIRIIPINIIPSRILILITRRNFSGLKRAGRKTTYSRLNILEVLKVAETYHLSRENIFKILQIDEEDIGLATIYSVFTQFENAELVKRSHFDDGQANTHLIHNVCSRNSRSFRWWYPC